MEGSALTIVSNLKNDLRTRGVRAWYRIMREAEGPEYTQLQELTEKVFGQGQKSVTAEEVPGALELWSSGKGKSATTRPQQGRHYTTP